jgi:Secretion system C-terminal sorting domain/SprB repeat
MKKALLIFGIFVFAFVASFAQQQSTPDFFHPQVGTTYLRSTTEGFSETIKLTLPDTIWSAGMGIPVDSMSIDSITGLPNGYLWKAGCGPTKRCIALPHIPTNIDFSSIFSSGITAAGIYNITIECNLYNPVFGALPASFNYYIEVYPDTEKHNLITSYITYNAGTSNTACNAWAKITPNKGTAPYTYKWSTGELTDSISKKCSNDYTVIVTDNSGLKDTLLITITDSISTVDTTYTNPNPFPFPNPGPVTCDTCVTGLTTYIATENELFTQDILFDFDSIFFTMFRFDSIGILSVEGLPNGISWKTDCGINNKCIYNKPGKYTLTLTGKSTAIGMDTVTIRTTAFTADTTQNNFDGIFDQTFVISTFPQSNSHTLISSYTSDNVSMFKMCDGVASVVVSNGTAPYTYKWSSGETTSKIFNKCSNKYTVNVSDSKGLKDSLDVYISEPTDTIQPQYFGFIPVDTVITNYDTCIVNYNLPIDSASVTTFTMLDSTHVSMDYAIYQGGKKIVFTALFSFDTIGCIAFDLALNCKGSFTKMLKSTVISQAVNLQYNQIGKTQTVAKNSLTAITEPLHNDQIVSIYPNPFSSETTITLSKEMNNASINVIDVFGRTVKTLKLTGTQVILEKGDLNAGIYFIQILNNGSVFTTKKVIVQ